MWYLKNISFLMAVGVLLLSGCASKPKVTAQTPIQDVGAPEWVVKGSGAFGGEKGRIFYGVGVAEKNQSVSIMRSKTDSRARSELAKMIQIYNASLTKDYEALTKTGEIKGVSEGHFEQAIKQATSMTLNGVEIVDHWQHPATGEFYALARLDLDALKNNFDKIEALNDRVRDYIRENADRLHKELEKEEERMRGGG